MRALSLFLLLSLAGCLSHLPVRTTTHLGIHWSPDYASAQREATRLQRPMLVCLIAGQIDGAC